MSTSWDPARTTGSGSQGQTDRPGTAVALAAAVCLGLAAPTGAAAAPAPTPGSERPGGTSTSAWVPRALPIIEVTGGSNGGTVHGSDGLDTFAGDTGNHAVLWRRGELIDLGPGLAYDVNLRGTAVGTVREEQRRYRAALWRKNAPVLLAVPPDATDSFAWGVNEAGTIVGSVYFPSEAGEWHSHAVVWSAQSPDRYRDLGTLDGEADRETRLYSVGENGVLAGYSTVRSTWEQQAFTGTARGGLQALADGGDDVQSRAVAVAGRYIAGAVRPAGADASRPTLWKDGVPHELPLLPGDEYSELSDVNARGTAVGNTSQGGAVWSPGQAPVILQGLDPNGYGSPQTITDRNVVGGSSIDSDGVYMPTLWVKR